MTLASRAFCARIRLVTVTRRSGRHRVNDVQVPTSRRRRRLPAASYTSHTKMSDHDPFYLRYDAFLSVENICLTPLFQILVR